MDAATFLHLVYLRRLVATSESTAQAIASVKADLRKARAALDALADPRELERTPAKLAAEDAAEQAARDKARAEADQVDAWLRTTEGRKHLRKRFAEQLAEARKAGAVA